MSGPRLALECQTLAEVSEWSSLRSSVSGRLWGLWGALSFSVSVSLFYFLRFKKKIFILMSILQLSSDTPEEGVMGVSHRVVVMVLAGI